MVTANDNNGVFRVLRLTSRKVMRSGRVYWLFRGDEAQFSLITRWTDGAWRSSCGSTITENGVIGQQRWRFTGPDRGFVGDFGGNV